jgi:hypothetical protein
MDWQGALRARLIAAAPVATLVWKDPETGVPAITWVDRPQANGLPAKTQTPTKARAMITPARRSYRSPILLWQ